MSEKGLEQFIGIERLYGRPALLRFLSSRICIVGVGGVGSWIAEAMARSGIGHVTLIDLDDICATNVNRQVHTLQGTIGRAKVDVMAERLRAIHPGICVTPQARFFTESNANELLGNAAYDLVFDAIDVVRPKCALLAGCRARQLPVITCGGAGGKLDPTRIQVADLARTQGDALLAQVRKRLRSDYDFPAGGRKPEAFGIQAIYSEEPPTYPPRCEGARVDAPPLGQSDASVGSAHSKPPPKRGLRCDAGFGSVTHMTAAFALHMSAQGLRQIATSATKPV